MFFKHDEFESVGSIGSDPAYRQSTHVNIVPAPPYDYDKSPDVFPDFAASQPTIATEVGRVASGAAESSSYNVVNHLQELA